MTYRLTTRFPSEERFGLTSQMRRAAVSLPSHITEGYGAGNDPGFSRFSHTAAGSNCELERHSLWPADWGTSDLNTPSSLWLPGKKSDKCWPAC